MLINIVKTGLRKLLKFWLRLSMNVCWTNRNLGECRHGVHIPSPFISNGHDFVACYSQANNNNNNNNNNRTLFNESEAH